MRIGLEAAPPAAAAAPAGSTLTVYAAASLKKTFTDIGERFKTDNPDWSVEFTFAGSSDLVTQLTQGAKADVFASADTKNMDKADARPACSRGTPVELRLQHAGDRDALRAIRRRSRRSPTWPSRA